MASSDFRRQLAGYGLTTAHIFYRRPDHPWLLQSYVWQEYDLCPKFPELQRFLDFWRKSLDGMLHSVTVAHSGLIKPADLRAALLDVLDGGAPMSSAIARRVVRSFRRPPANPRNEVHLSTREIEVLSLLSRGLSNKEIADEMRLSFETVRSYLKTIYEKLHVRCRTEAVIRYKATHPIAR